MTEREPDLGAESSAYKRGHLLYQHQRYREAQQQFVEHLKEYPDDANAMAYISLCLLRVGKKRRATEVASQAIKLDPECVFAHTSLAQCYRGRHMLAEARQSIREALRLDPGRADLLGLSAFISCDQKKWAEALEVSGQGLALDPYDENCGHAQSWALINTGRCDEARSLLLGMLANHPEDADSMAFLGYAALRQGKRDEALEHFSAALRSDAENELARDGFLDALRAAYPLYGLVIRYLMWISSLPDRLRWALMIVEHFLEKFLRETARRNPSLRPLINTLLWLWSVFTYLTFTARPLGNTLLRFSKYGRKILRPEEIMESNLVTASVGVGLASWLHWHFIGQIWSLVACLIYFTLVIPLTNIYTCQSGWPRKLMGGFAGALFVIGNLAIWGFWDSPLTGGSGRDLIQLYALLLMANQIVASQLEKIHPDS